MSNPTPTTPALRECPFCGEREKLEHDSDTIGDTRFDMYTVLCKSCGAEGPAGPNAAAAVVGWNGRAAVVKREVKP